MGGGPGRARPLSFAPRPPGGGAPHANVALRERVKRTGVFKPAAAHPIYGSARAAPPLPPLLRRVRQRHDMKAFLAAPAVFGALGWLALWAAGPF